MPLGTSGHASVLGGITANGGGRGGFGFGCAGNDIGCDQRGASGGSNGGAAYDNKSVNNTLVSGTAYVGATSRGNIGGASVGSGGNRAGSGGGGAGTVGASANLLHVGGAGGAGVRVDISGTSLIYACGGGGGINENIFGNPVTNYNVWLNQNTNEVVEDINSYLSLSYVSGTSAYSDTNGVVWTENYDQNEILYYSSDNGDTWRYYENYSDSDFSGWINSADPENQRSVDIWSILDSTTYQYTEYFTGSGNQTWIHNYNSNSDTYTSVNTQEVWSYGAISGGGAGGCEGAGRGWRARRAAIPGVKAPASPSRSRGW
jgi:hypothetical protein